jgi:hypothetical protein
VIVVVVTNDREGDFFAARFMPPTRQMTRGADRVYRIYSLEEDATASYRDINGDLLLEMKTFANAHDAARWVAEDMRQRHVTLAAGGRKQ